MSEHVYKTLRQFIIDKMAKDGEFPMEAGYPQFEFNKVLNDLVEYECDTPELDRWYTNDYVSPFYAWTKNFVYFLSAWEGRYCVDSIPRNPCTCEVKIMGDGGY